MKGSLLVLPKPHDAAAWPATAAMSSRLDNFMVIVLCYVGVNCNVSQLLGGGDCVVWVGEREGGRRRKGREMERGIMM